MQITSLSLPGAPSVRGLQTSPSSGLAVVDAFARQDALVAQAKPLQVPVAPAATEAKRAQGAGTAGRLGAFAANAGLSLAGGLAGGMALGLGIGALLGPAALGGMVRLGCVGGAVFGTAGGTIASGLAAHHGGTAFQPARALEVGAASGAGGTIVAFGLVLLALRGLT